MDVSPLELHTLVVGFVWVLARVAGFVGALPVPVAAGVPVVVRAAIALVFAFLVTPFVPAFPDVEPLSARGLFVLVQEVLVGVAAALVVRVVFAAVQLAGHLISVQMGLGFAVLVDPRNSEQLSLLSHLYYLLAILLFLAMDAHLLLVDIMVNSFTAAPIGEFALSKDTLWSVVRWGAVMFQGSVQIALPVLVALLLVNLAFGVITRAAPQLNVFAIGFPVTLLLGFLAVLYTVSSLPAQLAPLFGAGLDHAARVSGVPP